MSASSIIFYMIAAFILGTGILAVTSSRIFRSAIWLLFSLIGIGALFFWMQVEFIAAVQIIVYAGGIVVLIIFSIFLTQQSGSRMPKPLMKRKIFSALAVLSGFGLSAKLIWEHVFAGPPSQPFTLRVSDVGERMLGTGDNGYVLPFEVVSMLLLAAMIGCIVIAMKSEPEKEKIKQLKENRTGPSALIVPEKQVSEYSGQKEEELK